MTFLLGILEDVIGGLILYYLIKTVEKRRCAVNGKDKTNG